MDKRDPKHIVDAWLRQLERYRAALQKITRGVHCCAGGDAMICYDWCPACSAQRALDEGVSDAEAGDK